MLDSKQLRALFLRFFEEKGHSVLPGSSLIPHGDPTLLLTTAGMVQIKPYFLGLATPPNPRLASCQKCFRTTDIDRVGDSSHLTFFEMLGNFSVGDYFKKEAIAWAWELVTRRLGIPAERLWVSIFLDDDEAFGYWRQMKVPADRIVRLGEKDNFWGPAGDSGPCGPCSEIHYDFGPEHGCGKADCRPGCSCGRFMEIWNLVFTQYDQDREGKRTLLPKPNIDTGMGLERLAVVMQGGKSVYDTDLFRPLLEQVSRMTGKQYGGDEKTDTAIRVVAEHSRGITFLIADGVIPGNEGRGYVLRRVLRRTALFGRRLGLEGPFLGQVAGTVVDLMADIYPELKDNRGLILRVIEIEEAKFVSALDTGLGVLEGMMAELTVAEATKVLPGDKVFHLHDTYGFPVELTEEIAREQGLAVDREGFEVEMARQRERARAAHKFKVGSISDYAGEALPATEFTGYEELSTQARIVSLRTDGNTVEEAREGQEVEIVLDRTPFYAEMGGQVTDTGAIEGKSGKVEVSEAVWAGTTLVVHRGKMSRGVISLAEKVTAEIDAERRSAIAQHHTATHLLQSALRRVLGGHVRQKGSLVAPERLRFDFSHLEALSETQLLEAQRLVNGWIRQDLPATVRETTYQEAVERGAIALFGEKYGERVRLLEIGQPPVSAELCGGTHLRATGEIGMFHILSETSIGAGLRRIEAVAGKEMEMMVERRFAELGDVARQLQAPPEETPAKLAALLEELAAERRGTQILERELSRRVAQNLLEQVESIDGKNVLSARVNGLSLTALREVGDMVRERLKSGIVVLGTVHEDKPHFLAMVTSDLIAQGFHAGNILKQVARVAGGGGGGRAEMGQAGGRDKEKLDEALALVRKLVSGR
ncbi:MAG: alanine--tRNA ligase [Dehalococcoidia bacterium]|nr:alanine--tRNA ligase [Dehalococcoidia bacterium]